MTKKKILIFSGAGVSAESGVKTFRDHNGLWDEYDVFEVASMEGWRRNRGKVLEFYNKRRRELPNVQPNLAHKVIAELENYFDVSVVTQNVDDLHERAGSTKIIHLHGELTKARGSLYNNKQSPLDHVIDIGYNDINEGDKCPMTGSQLRPNIVWFGENLNSDDIEKSETSAYECDVCVVVGTSMKVSPANTIPFFSKVQTLIYYVDPGEMDFFVPDFRKPYFKHIKEVASIGMEKVKNDLMGKFL